MSGAIGRVVLCNNKTATDRIGSDLFAISVSVSVSGCPADVYGGGARTLLPPQPPTRAILHLAGIAASGCGCVYLCVFFNVYECVFACGY